MSSELKTSGEGEFNDNCIFKTSNSILKAQRVNDRKRLLSQNLNLPRKSIRKNDINHNNVNEVMKDNIYVINCNKENYDPNSIDNSDYLKNRNFYYNGPGGFMIRKKEAKKVKNQDFGFYGQNRSPDQREIISILDISDIANLRRFSGSNVVPFIEIYNAS